MLNAVSVILVDSSPVAIRCAEYVPREARYIRLGMIMTR